MCIRDRCSGYYWLCARPLLHRHRTQSLALPKQRYVVWSDKACECTLADFYGFRFPMYLYRIRFFCEFAFTMVAYLHIIVKFTIFRKHLYRKAIWFTCTLRHMKAYRNGLYRKAIRFTVLHVHEEYNFFQKQNQFFICIKQNSITGLARKYSWY